MRSFCLYFIVLSILSQGFTNKEPTEDMSDDSEDECSDEDECKTNIKDFVGTNLFGDDGCVKKCFSSEDVALLIARKDFENILPKDMPKCLLDDELIDTLMQYFYGANQVILRMSNGDAKIFAQKAFYDALGGYLHHYLIPVTTYSFYAGIITLKTTMNILQLYNQCKVFLNTNGNGWRSPTSDFSEFDLTIEPIKFLKTPKNERNDEAACVNLNMADEKSENDDEMIVALPKLEPEEYGLLSNIWLPFKRKHSFNLRSHSSAFILLRYYVMVSRCYTFQEVCQDTFNNKFKDWFQENLELHLSDDILYPGLGAVLRILESIRHRKKFVPVEAKVPQSILNIGDQLSSLTVRKPTSKYLKLKNKADKLSDPELKNNLEFEPQPQSQSKSNIMDDFVSYEDEENTSIKARRKKYITMAVIIALFLLVFILAVAVITKYMSDKCDKDGNKNKKGICKARQRKSDDEVELSKDSPSVVSSGKKKKKDDEEKTQSPKDTKKSRKQQPPPSQSQRRKSSTAKPSRSSSSTSPSSSTSSPKKSGTPRKTASPSRKKGEVKIDTIDEKGKSKRFSISKKGKPASPPKPNAPKPKSPKRKGGVEDSAGVTTAKPQKSPKSGISSGWETIN